VNKKVSVPVGGMLICPAASFPTDTIKHRRYERPPYAPLPVGRISGPL
jgi:hypothetical protein